MKRESMGDEAGGAVTPAPTAGGRTLPRLRGTDVDVWCIRLDEQPDAVLATLRDQLSADEEERARKFYFERDRRRYVAGRGVLRVLLGRYLGCAAHAVAFRYGPNGKPELAGGAAEVIHFNMAHSEGLALCAITRSGAIGIDVEHVRDLPDWEYIAATCFAPPDRARVENAPADQRRTEFFRAWTRQEALLKATGVGLGGVPLNAAPSAGVPYTDGENPAFCCVRPVTHRVFPLRIAEEYPAAVAVVPTARWLTCFLWDNGSGRGGAGCMRRSRRMRLEQTAEMELQFL
jgi:4'-phosphopantetheinyl transferase